MTIVAEKDAHVIGVDTHARTHTCAIVSTAAGVCSRCEAFPVTNVEKKRAIAWIRRGTDWHSGHRR